MTNTARNSEARKCALLAILGPSHAQETEVKQHSFKDNNANTQMQPVNLY